VRFRADAVDKFFGEYGEMLKMTVVSSREKRSSSSWFASSGQHTTMLKSLKNTHNNFIFLHSQVTHQGEVYLNEFPPQFLVFLQSSTIHPPLLPLTFKLHHNHRHNIHHTSTSLSIQNLPPSNFICFRTVGWISDVGSIAQRRKNLLENIKKLPFSECVQR
jgi:hypothetical protein